MQLSSPELQISLTPFCIKDTGKPLPHTKVNSDSPEWKGYHEVDTPPAIITVATVVERAGL